MNDDLELELDVWYVFNNDHRYIYGAKTKCFRTALFDDAGNQVGEESGYNSRYPVQGSSEAKVYSRYGLHVCIKQIKKWTPPKKKEPDSQVNELVIIKRFNRDGSELESLVKEHRAVYTSSKGRYIKTRADGRVYLTFDDPATVHYKGWKPVKPGERV